MAANYGPEVRCTVFKVLLDDIQDVLAGGCGGNDICLETHEWCPVWRAMGKKDFAAVGPMAKELFPAIKWEEPEYYRCANPHWLMSWSVPDEWWNKEKHQLKVGYAKTPRYVLRVNHGIRGVICGTTNPATGEHITEVCVEWQNWRHPAGNQCIYKCRDAAAIMELLKHDVTPSTRIDLDDDDEDVPLSWIPGQPDAQLERMVKLFLDSSA